MHPPRDHSVGAVLRGVRERRNSENPAAPSRPPPKGRGLVRDFAVLEYKISRITFPRRLSGVFASASSFHKVEKCVSEFQILAVQNFPQVL